MCTLSFWYWVSLALTIAFAILTIYLNHRDRETDRYIASLERENDRLTEKVSDLEEKLEIERERTKATINLLTKE